MAPSKVLACGLCSCLNTELLPPPLSPQGVRAGQADYGGAEDPPQHPGDPGTDECRGARQGSHLATSSPSERAT